MKKEAKDLKATKSVYKIWCEWDLGLENKVFSTRKKAIDTLKKLDWVGLGIEMEEGETVETMLNDRIYLGIDVLKVK